MISGGLVEPVGYPLLFAKEFGGFYDGREDAVILDEVERTVIWAVRSAGGNDWPAGGKVFRILSYLRQADRIERKEACRNFESVNNVVGNGNEYSLLCYESSFWDQSAP